MFIHPWTYVVLRIGKKCQNYRRQNTSIWTKHFRKCEPHWKHQWIYLFHLRSADVIWYCKNTLGLIIRKVTRIYNLVLCAPESEVWAISRTKIEICAFPFTHQGWKQLMQVPLVRYVNVLTPRKVEDRIGFIFVGLNFISQEYFISIGNRKPPAYFT